MPGIAAWRSRGDEGPRPLRRGRQWSRYRTGGRRTGGSPSFSCPATSAGRARTALSVQGAGRRHACGPYGSRPRKRPQASTAKGERAAARRAGSSATEDGREVTGRQPCLQHAIPKRLRGKASAVRMSRESGRSRLRALPGLSGPVRSPERTARTTVKTQRYPCANRARRGREGSSRRGLSRPERVRGEQERLKGDLTASAERPPSKIRRYPQ